MTVVPVAPPPPLRAWEWTGLGVAVLAFVVLRLPLYTSPGIFLGWHSDAALLGLMASGTVWGQAFVFRFQVRRELLGMETVRRANA